MPLQAAEYPERAYPHSIGSDRVAERPAPAPSDGIPYLLHAGALSEQKDGIMAMLQGYAVARERLGGKLRFVFTYKVGFPGCWPGSTASSPKTASETMCVLPESSIGKPSRN